MKSFITLSTTTMLTVVGWNHTVAICIVISGYSSTICFPPKRGNLHLTITDFSVILAFMRDGSVNFFLLRSFVILLVLLVSFAHDGFKCFYLLFLSFHVLYIYVYVYICMYIFICMCIYVYIRMYVYIRI